MNPKQNINLHDLIAKAESLGMKVKVSPGSELLVQQPAGKKKARPHDERDRRKGKVKLFTHNDTDGVSCGILAKLAFGDRIHIDYCNYDDINNKIQRFIQEFMHRYDQVFITDISVNEEIAAQIDELVKQGKIRFQLLDHHQTAGWLNQYEWASVQVRHENEKLASGTSLYYRHLTDSRLLAESEKLSAFVELVRQYDTWDWKELNNQHAKQLNDLFYITGRDRFLNRFVYDSSIEFTEAEVMLLELEQDKIDKYIKSKSRDVIFKEICGYKAGIVFAEQYVSELGNALAEQHPEVDFIAMVNVGRVISYRTVKEDINLGDIAGVFGGGGHQKAAGSPVAPELREKIVHLLFSEVEEALTL
ncbi:oligoribonuclease [Aneurinibacillus sp. Ricciae_BoGa-3]|uniref:DHH family phosphoesterase n=1 Tax=Aneurinibacillus sp. Ricciae_BoGa-3 TaxID=3022697 RepID=UPI00234172AF|nr:oligoribonuclease [Aneurinibacillus sp. Ricciae_BoGa-3]WCK54009.1 oligoribonuclease [Aneurinibacillus sp. Ricciae_BoGa-3]